MQKDKLNKTNNFFYNTKDIYKEYKNQVEKPVSILVYISILNGFMKFLVRKVLDKGEIMFPERAGVLKIIGSKPKIRFEDGKIKGLVPDWYKTKKLWEKDEEAKQKKILVYHFNEETNNIRYRYLWSRKSTIISNKSLYVLTMTRENKRTLSKRIQEGKEYIIL